MKRYKQTTPIGCGLHCFSNLFQYDFVSLMDENHDLGSMNEFQENEVISSVYPNVRIKHLFYADEVFRPFLWNGLPKLIDFLTKERKPELKKNQYVACILTVIGNPLHCVNLYVYNDRMVLDNPCLNSCESYYFYKETYQKHLATAWLKRRVRNIQRIGVYCEYGDDKGLRPLIFEHGK